MFLNPLGLLALFGVPAVVALHLFRRRFQRRRVSALFLWEARSTTSLSGRRRERLLRSPSFWSELLLALLLGLAFAGPRACGTLEARHLVVVLDGSASMAAGAGTEGTEGTASPIEEALAELRTRIDELPSGSRVTVVESGVLPRIAIGPAAFPAEAGARLTELRPSAGRHDLGPAVALALEVAGEGAVTLYTDRFTPEAFPESVGVVALGSPRENLAIVRALRSLAEESTQGDEEVLLTIANLSGRRRTTYVLLSGEAGPLAREELVLDPGERVHLRFELPPETAEVVARLEADAFPLDDEVLLLPTPRRELALAAQLAEGEAVFLGLERAGGEPLGRWRRLVPRSRSATAEEAHLLVAHEEGGGPETWCLLLQAPGTERADLFGGFLLERRHPLLEGVELDGVVWSASTEARLPGLPLLSAGELPLLTEERRGARRLFHLNVDWSRSSLQTSADWPILLDNLARLRRDELDGPRSTNLALGETLHFQAREPATYRLSGPGKTRELRAQGALAVEGLDEVGRYRLEREGVQVTEIAVHFGDDAESDLRGASRGERPSAVELAEEESGSSWVVLLLGTLALAALLLDWWFLRARPARDWIPLPTRKAS